MGAAIAWYAARRGDPLREPVVLLEKERLAAGSSGRSGAILRQHYADRVVAAMARDSLRVYAGLEARTGRSIGFERTGVMTIAASRRPEDVARLERNVAMQASIGIDARRVDAREMRALVPGIAVADDAVGAWEPDGGGVDPVRTVETIAALAREQSAITRVGVAATDLVVVDGRVAGVETSEGTIETGRVVVATGPWTRAWLARAGVDVPLRVVRPEQHFVSMPPSPRTPPIAPEPARTLDPIARIEATEPRPRSVHPVVLDLELGYYTRCEPVRSRTRIGRVDYARDREVGDPDALDESVDREFVAWARDRLSTRLPAYRARADAGSEVGMYTLSPDAQALIGPIAALPGLFVVSGFSGHGFKLAPSIGEGVAQMIDGEPVSAFDLDFFSPTRFTGGSAARGGAFGL